MRKQRNKELFALLVRVYNHTIQSYYNFPEVIMFGKHHLEKAEFYLLVNEGYIFVYYADSFGKSYRLSKKANEFLYQYNTRRRKSCAEISAPPVQYRFQFV